jgi:hypothetical protein
MAARRYLSGYPLVRRWTNSSALLIIAVTELKKLQMRRFLHHLRLERSTIAVDRRLQVREFGPSLTLFATTCCHVPFHCYRSVSMAETVSEVFSSCILLHKQIERPRFETLTGSGVLIYSSESRILIPDEPSLFRRR